MMADKTKKQKQKELDALYIIHNPLDCLIVYFCVCFTCIRAIYDIFYRHTAFMNIYIISLVFTICMGLVMTLWARRVFRHLGLGDKW